MNFSLIPYNKDSIMDAKTAKSLSENSTARLDVILRAIKERAITKFNYLDLYDWEPGDAICGGDAYFRTFDYTNDELTKLRELGYRVEEERQTITDGILWWTKVIFTDTYHRICW